MVAEDSIEDLRAAVDVGAKLRVTVDDATEDLAETVRAVEGVESVHVDGNELVVGADDEAKTRVISALEDAGATVENFRTVEASLEDLFATYTTEQGETDADGSEDEVAA
jgi:ABC-2 type transport system ATP-binding protein